MTTTIATAADYADAMLTARRAKNLLFWLLLLFLLVQVTMFFLIRFKVLQIEERGGTATVSVTAPEVRVSGSAGGDASTRPAEGGAEASASVSVTTQPAEEGRTASVSASPRAVKFLLDYGNGLIVFLGMVFSVLLAVVILLLLAVMLVGRLIGVSQVTSAFIWSVALALILFPWQIFYDNPRYEPARFPGALYTWSELETSAQFGMDPSPGAERMSTSDQIMKWARFVGFPVVAMVLLLMIQSRSSRGLRMALGESDVSVTVDEHPAV